MSTSYKFQIQLTQIEHSCSYGNTTEPIHPLQLNLFLLTAQSTLNNMTFHGSIKALSNNSQIDYSMLDTQFLKGMASHGWLDNLKHGVKLGESNREVDAMLINNNIRVAIEIEKANEKTIWIDYMKILKVLRDKIADFGVLIVPRNYPHSRGVWKLFDRAREYRTYLLECAGVDVNLFAKIAIIGYTQSVEIEGVWVKLDENSVVKVKSNAKW